ncbi:MAG: hypothetical protein ACRCTE_00705, partial [Cellulosilyticaceae bacterium]
MQMTTLILEIMENTLSTLTENKNSIVSITQKLQDDLEKKKQELEKIKEELPQIFDYTKRLKTADQKMREQLA